VTSSTNPASVAFVIPVVHPEGAKVDDYRVVEAILRETVTSLLAQQRVRPHVVVVCHRRPSWSVDLPEVRFLLLDHPAFAANRNVVQVDKGLKYAIGIAYALAAWDPALVMPMDDDDFVRRDASAHVLRSLREGDGTEDAGLLTRGYHVVLRPGRDGRGFDVRAVFEVRQFHTTCGSCRMFHGDRLRALLFDALPELVGFGATDIADAEGVVRRDFLDAFLAVAEPLAPDHDGILNILGRHVEQERLELLPLDALPLVAKGCGHGNHDGPRAGEVHWHQIRSVRRTRRFLERFGLSGRATLRARPDPRAAFAGWRAAIKNRIRPVLRATLRR